MRWRPQQASQLRLPQFALLPQVQQMRRMREAGELGDILVVQGTYSQDWLLYDTDWNWRVDAKAGGASRCMARYRLALV